MLPAINQNITIMSRIVDFSDFSDLEQQIDELYELYDHVEYIRSCGDNSAEFYCA